jgi:hypothetical protein
MHRLRLGYLKYRFLSSMRPVGELYKPGYLGSISDPSSMIENTVLAASLAFEMLGI